MTPATLKPGVIRGSRGNSPSATVTLNEVVLTEVVPPVTVGDAETPEAVVDTEDVTEELDVTEAAVLSAEADVDDEAASSVADEETVAAVVLASSCRGSGCAIPAKTILKHKKKQRRTPHIPGVGVARILQTRRRDTGNSPTTPRSSHSPVYFPVTDDSRGRGRW